MEKLTIAKSISLFLILAFSALFINVNTYYADAARCGSSNEEELGERYDDAVDDFDDFISDEGVSNTIRDIRSAIRRVADGGSLRHIELAIEELEETLDRVEVEGDNLFDDYRALRNKSRFEDDCRDEVEDNARKLEKYFEDKLDDYKDDVEELDDDFKEQEDEREDNIYSVRAPTIDFGDDDDDDEDSNDEFENQEEVKEEIKRLLARITELFVVYNSFTR